MAYWWVNLGQPELAGDYIWSPKTNEKGGPHQTYEHLKEVAVGDVVFAYIGGEIKAVGRATATYQNQLNPALYSESEDSQFEGWLVPVKWQELTASFRPRVYLHLIAPRLPEKYAPIRVNGERNRKCYLAKISDGLGQLLMAISDFATHEPWNSHEVLSTTLAYRRQERDILNGQQSNAKKVALLLAAQGQGPFKDSVVQRERFCRLTGVAQPDLLKAVHIQPWLCSSNQQRLDPNNALLLAPHAAHLFEGGFISFEADGTLLIRNEVVEHSLEAWGLPLSIPLTPFRAEQHVYLSYHREHVFGSSVDESTQ